MKRLFLGVMGMLLSAGYAAADCPQFTGIASWGNHVYYNLNATPWNFTLDVSGDTIGMHVQWYTYGYVYGQTLADTVVYNGPGSQTVNHCYPATDASVPLSTTIHYVCVVKTTHCPQGIIYNDASVLINGTCATCDGHTITLLSAPSVYTEGDRMVLTANYTGQGGYHYYVWTKDGVILDSTAQHGIWNDPDNFNYSVLTLPSVQLSDAGQYSVSVTDGTDASGSPCYLQLNAPKIITIHPRPSCDSIVYRKWEDVLFVNNSGNRYVSYQWYRDQTAIAGATKQYYYGEGQKLQGDGHRYYVVATMANGQTVTSCEEVFEDFPRSVDGRQRVITHVALYTQMGLKVGEWSSQPAHVPMARGVYVWHFTDDQGQSWTQKTVY